MITKVETIVDLRREVAGVIPAITNMYTNQEWASVVLSMVPTLRLSTSMVYTWRNHEESFEISSYRDASNDNMFIVKIQSVARYGKGERIFTLL